MKNILFILVLSAVSTSSFASEAMETMVISQTETDTSFLIKNPVHPGGANLPMSFDYWSEEIGVCKALGYDSVAAKSTRFSDTQVDALQVNETGKIVGGESKAAVTQIVCLNKTGKVSTEKTTIILNPKHPTSGLPLSFAYWSEEIGVCKALGYDSVAAKSTRFGDDAVDAIQVNENGKVVGGEKKAPVTQIVCIN